MKCETLWSKYRRREGVWFAWHPVVAADARGEGYDQSYWVWLEYVNRKEEGTFYPYWVYTSIEFEGV